MTGGDGAALLPAGFAAQELWRVFFFAALNAASGEMTTGFKGAHDVEAVLDGGFVEEGAELLV
jgi:hypothetical protein